MKTLQYLIIFLVFMSGCKSREFYVSLNGSDQNPGTKAKPFLTIQKARQAVRTELTNGMNGDITVYLADGKYFIPETLHFNPDDSGNNGLKVTYKAGKGANPEISGGIEITGWVQEQPGLWVANIPDELVGTSFRELFVNGKRFTRATHPNDSYLRVAEVGADRRTNFCFLEGDFPHPHSQQQVELVLLHDWSITRIPIAMIDYNLNRITAVDSIGEKGLNFFNLDNWEKNPRYFLENDIAFLDAPGEWFFDILKNCYT